MTWMTDRIDKLRSRPSRKSGSTDEASNAELTCSQCTAKATGWVYQTAAVDGVDVIDGFPVCPSHALTLARDAAG